MRKKLIMVIMVCFACSGCKSFESFLKRDESIPVIVAGKPQVETEAVWVSAKTRKVWVNPHIDDDGSMIDGHYKYVILEEGHWALQEIAPDAPLQVKQNAVEDSLRNE